jgi:Tol biopolymer transport system component
MLHRCTLAAVASVSVLCDSLASEVGVTWLTVPQRDDRRSRNSAASVSLSGDGRHVAFRSYARLSAADADSLADIYVLDRSTATVTLESASVEGREVNADCGHPSISADGRYVTFITVVADDADRGVTDVVLRDRVASTSRRITLAPGGAPANGWSSEPVLSADASAIVFASAATNLMSEPDENGTYPDIYRFDVGSGAIERISVDASGAQRLGGSLMPGVSGDGRYVVFSSTAALSGPRNGSDRPLRPRQYPSIYLRDTRTRQTTLLNGASEPPNGGSTMAAISADGRTIVFASRATNLVSRDRNKASDVFLYDVGTRAVTLVSRGTGGGTANGASLNPAISADGRLVAFQSEASDMACGRHCGPGMEDINLLPDVFVFDRVTGQISCVSLDRQARWLEESGAPAIDASGRVVAFTSRHPISSGDVLNDFDLFVRSGESLVAGRAAARQDQEHAAALRLFTSPPRHLVTVHTGKTDVDDRHLRARKPESSTLSTASAPQARRATRIPPVRNPASHPPPGSGREPRRRRGDFGCACGGYRKSS